MPGPRAFTTDGQSLSVELTPTLAPEVLDEMPDGLLVIDGSDRIAYANRAARALLHPTDPDGLTVGELRLLDDRGNDWWDCTASVRRLPSVSRAPERRLAITDARGGERGLSVTARYVRDDSGRLVRTVLSLRDTAAADRSEHSRADLVSTVAHELRSPLTSVKGFTATLLAKWDRFSDEQKQLMLQTVNADADRVTRLLAELLDVSRIDAGRLELHRQVVDVGAAVRKAFAGRIASGESPSRFVLLTGTPLPELWLDPDKIDQIIGNLVENAVRHGDGTVTVTLRPLDAARGSGAELTVDDEGEGIPASGRARVFRRFWRGPRTRRGGTGLGLYIVKGLVEAHGGGIAVESAPSGGARFRVWLPAGSPPYAS